MLQISVQKDHREKEKGRREKVEGNTNISFNSSRWQVGRCF
jgi:hypothetical protein